MSPEDYHNQSVYLLYKWGTFKDPWSLRILFPSSLKHATLIVFILNDLAMAYTFYDNILTGIDFLQSAVYIKGTYKVQFAQMSKIHVYLTSSIYSSC